MRFRLKSVFLLTFLVALVCMVLFTLPDWPAIVILAALATVTPGALVAGIIYGRGAKRAFAIGGLASGGWVLWGAPYFYYMGILGEVDSDATLAKMLFVAAYGLLLLAGLASVGVRRLCYQGRNGIRPPRDCC